jgi:Ca-activated chloride channel family protein
MVLSLCVVFFAGGTCFGRGLLIPKDQTLPPLAIKSHRVTVTIDSQLATTRVEQVFQNNTDRVLEATYIFPLPPGAVINDFAMYMNGKRVSGELVEKNQARQIYTEIVRRMRDPGILEYMGGNLFKLNVFPIPANGKQKIEVQYSEVLSRDSGMHRYTYPLKTEEPASQTLEDFTIGITLKSSEAITNIYSPTHKLGITRNGEREATIGFEQDKALLDRDVVLYYTVSDRAFGVNVLSHKPEKDKAGYFMMMITPRTFFEDKDILPRDVCFVLDTSGSMQTDNKLKQAKDALKYCVSSLREKDRFTVIAFSTGVSPMTKELLTASAANKEKAGKFIDGQEAMGGTAIYAALLEATSIRRTEETERPYIVVFLTDGRPTIGEDRDDEIVGVASLGGGNVRIFTWGVGNDVNTHLLDRIAEKTRALSEYVGREENIEQKVSLFFNKMSKPVLASPKIDWGKIKVHDVYPKDIGDLFAGQQLTILGRYEDTGDTALSLEGAVLGKKATQTFEGTFAKDAGNSFIEKLWASRHVGFLLDEIRLHGEKQELKDEVIRLSRTYGIQTPYTSYLVLETKEDYARHGLTYSAGGTSLTPAATRENPAFLGVRSKLEADGRRLAADRTSVVPSAAPSAQRVITEGYKQAGTAGETRDAEEVLRDVSGKDAVRVAKAIGELKRGETAEVRSDGKTAVSLVKRIDERTFYFYAGFWVDGDFTDKLEKLHVKYLSDGYFSLLEKLPDLKKVFAIGERLIVVVNKTALVVDDEGKEKLDDAEMKALLGK